ncbi:hypothetical protein [Parasitella parasitica]|uniref:Transposase Tc1-like domain-containing protein n=1 Tax=Parasitella parasitica TaxID=35722 RepID=A0A0B7MY98_9FUNG|nr:hypothetical protein [Parasitella parasitica]
MLTNITCCEKAYILGLSKGGIDVDQIAKEVKRLASGIYKILKKCDEEPSTKPVGKQGRPSKLTEGSKRSEITNASVDNVSKATVRHALHEVKLNNRIARMKPYLSNKHITQRLIVAGHHLNWTLEQWSKRYT